jgi:peptidoglycan/xylan/chitin deacetylase (PgdA/CDA1 family)
LAYHSISPGAKIAPALFETHIKALAASGLPSLLPHELSESRRGFMLTFDDGYADLWTHGFALLKKYNIKALVFVIPSKIGNGAPRPIGQRAFQGSVNQALRESAKAGRAHPGFLRWSELEAMEASGLVNAQSHSYFHRMGWISDGIIGFHLPPHRPAHWSLAQATGGDERPGIPVYKRGSALGHRLYFDDPGLRDHLAEWHAKHCQAGDPHSPRAALTMRKLHEVSDDYRAKYPDRGRWEENEEREKRSIEDIRLARRNLEERLGGRRDELCLPWGHYDRATLSIAAKAGIKRIYTLDKGANPAEDIGFAVSRFEPRSRGKLWLRTRLWIYRSVLRAKAYAWISGRTA